MVYADGFASSPAGYIAGIILPAAVLMIGFLGRRALSRVDTRFFELEKSNREQSVAMTTNTQALAILVERIAPMQTAIAQNSSAVTTLNEATAVLKEKISSHEAWAQREHERVLKKLGA